MKTLKSFALFILFVLSISIILLQITELSNKTDIIVTKSRAIEILDNDMRVQKHYLDLQKAQLADYRNYTEQMLQINKNNKNKISKLNQQIIDYKDIIVYKDLKYSQKVGVIMKPTYQQVVDFLESDTTSDKEWTYDYDCTQFAHDTIKNALAEGIFGCVVNMDFARKFQGHDIIAFDTLEFGVLYFEPTTDVNVYMYAGMDYSGYLGYDDEIHLIVRQYDSCFERVN